MYMCVGLRERMSYGMYCTCIIGTRRSKSALPIKTCWILWIPNPVTRFCLSTSPFFFYCLTTWQWIRGMDTVIFASNNTNGMQSQFRESDKMIKLILVFMQQFAVLICAVRQSQSRHSVSGCHIRHCLAQSVAGDCVRVCVCEATLGLFLVVLEGYVLLQKKAGLTELRLSAYLPFAGGLPQPFSPSDCSLHTNTPVRTLTLPREAAVSAADFHAFKSTPLWSMDVFVSERVKKCGVITLGTVDSARVTTGTKLEMNRSSLAPVTVLSALILYKKSHRHRDDCLHESSV